MKSVCAVSDNEEEADWIVLSLCNTQSANTSHVQSTQRSPYLIRLIHLLSSCWTLIFFKGSLRGFFLYPLNLPWGMDGVIRIWTLYRLTYGHGRLGTTLHTGYQMLQMSPCGNLLVQCYPLALRGKRGSILPYLHLLQYCYTGDRLWLLSLLVIPLSRYVILYFLSWISPWAYSKGRCGSQWDRWSKVACFFPCVKSIIFWVLVQLLHCNQQSGPRHVLVWNTGMIVLYLPFKPLISRQTYTGSECIYQMLKAIWPSVAHVPNHLPKSANITTSGSSGSSQLIGITLNGQRAGLMCYFIYWLIQFPLMLLSPHKIRHFFTVKSITVPIAWMAILIWAMVKVPAKISLASKGSSLSGSSLSWAWLNSLNSALGFYATVSINIPDFTVRLVSLTSTVNSSSCAAIREKWKGVRLTFPHDIIDRLIKL